MRTPTSTAPHVSKSSLAAAARAVTTDDPVAHFIGLAHAATTTKSYQSTVRRYNARFGDGAPTPITTVHARQWLAETGAAGASAASVQSYRSALATEHVKNSAMDHSFISGSNPLHCPTIDMVVAGIKKSQALAAPRLTLAQVARAAQGNVVTAAMIEQLATSWAGTTEYNELLLAAAAISTEGMFRPNELFGSQAYPDRALKMGQVAFDQGATVVTKMTGEARDIDASTLASPTTCTITLYTTKTNQSSRPSFTTLTDPTAVTAMWQWICRRRQSTDDGVVFRRDGWARLTVKELMKQINAELCRLGTPSDATPKAFRRGGASDRSAGGDSAASINQQGRWAATSRVALEVYASTAAKRARSIARPGQRQ